MLKKLKLNGSMKTYKTFQNELVGYPCSPRDSQASSPTPQFKIDLGYCGIEWLALEMNRDHSVIFEIASKYCILDSFVDYDS